MKKLRIAAAAVLCLALSGCTGLSLNGPDLLAPPTAEGNQAQIQKLIQKNAGSSYEMVYPENGTYKSSVIFRDLDNDGDEEAVAMYAVDKSSARILIADSSGSDYGLIGECQIDAGRLDSIGFADFDGDGNTEIVVCYPANTASLNTLTVISVGQDAEQKDITDACAAYLIADFDGDGRDDLLTLTVFNGTDLPTAKLFGGDRFPVERSNCEIASEPVQYVSLSFGKITEGSEGAIIDAVDGNGVYSTQMICYDNTMGGIINPLYLNDNYTKTRRSAAITSTDIDGDGIYEVPLCRLMDYSQNEESSAVCDRVDWCCYDYLQLAFATKRSAVLGDRLGFLLNLNPEHAEYVTARYIGENSVSLYLWEYKNNTPTRTVKLLTVKRYPKNDFDETAVLEAVAGRNSDYVYTYVIDSEGSYYSYTDNEVTDNFILLENQSEN